MKKNRIMSVRKLALRCWALITQPFFWGLTFLGNAIIAGGAYLLYLLESDHQELNYLDAVVWTSGIVTTIGYGDWEVHTTLGKFVLVGLMLLGTLFVWLYMIFLVTGLITPELSSLESDMHDLEREVQDLLRASSEGSYHPHHGDLDRKEKK